MFMLEGYYGALSFIFSPIIGLPPALAEFIIAAIITLIITVFYRYLIDQNKVRDIRVKTKEIQKKIKETKDKEESSKLTNEMFSLSNQQMKMSFKPMIVALIFAILILPWLRVVFTGPIVTLPFDILGRTTLGWFLWYVIVSIPLSFVFRKVLGVV